jgi:photosystem II stability/assembly factor-like uncharacterized protein
VSAPPPKQPGHGWTAYASGTTDALHSVFPVDTREVWIAGDSGTLLHTSDHGKTFSRCTVDPNESLTGLWASGPDVVWITGSRNVHRVEGGTTLATLSVAGARGTGSEGVWGTSGTDVWIATGALMHTIDGGDHWSDATARVHGLPQGTDQVWVAGHDVWASVPFSAVHSADDGATWTDSGWMPQTENTVRVRGGAADDVWIVASAEGLIHSTDKGATWTVEGPPSLGNLQLDPLHDLYTAGGGWAFAASGGLSVRMGRLPWVREVDLRIDMYSIRGTSRDDVWAVGDRGIILHRP